MSQLPLPFQDSPLSLQALNQVVDLKNHPGYLLLLDILQAKYDTLGDALRESKTDEQARQLLAQWRVFYEILFTLKTVPEALAADFKTQFAVEGLDQESYDTFGQLVRKDEPVNLSTPNGLRNVLSGQRGMQTPISPGPAQMHIDLNDQNPFIGHRPAPLHPSLLR